MDIFSKSPWQLHMQERLITWSLDPRHCSELNTSQQLGSGAQSIQSERSVPPIPVVCQCKCLDDQGRWPVLPTRTAVVARLEKRGRRGVSFCDRALCSACDVKRQKSTSESGPGDESREVAGPFASIFSKILAWPATCKTISTSSAILGTKECPARDLAGCRSKVRYCGCKVVVGKKEKKVPKALRLGHSSGYPDCQIPMSIQCKMMENHLDGTRLHVPGLAIG